MDIVLCSYLTFNRFRQLSRRIFCLHSHTEVPVVNGCDMCYECENTNTRFADHSDLVTLSHKCYGSIDKQPSNSHLIEGASYFKRARCQNGLNNVAYCPILLIVIHSNIFTIKWRSCFTRDEITRKRHTALCGLHNCANDQY